MFVIARSECNERRGNLGVKDTVFLSGGTVESVFNEEIAAVATLPRNDEEGVGIPIILFLFLSFRM